jgi:subtilisin-like proprotein convertase family protein
MPFPSQILSKPYLITATDYQIIGTEINLVGVDDLQLKKENTKSYASPRLLNWVEPYEINGVKKSLFYTEVNSNIQVGDRVWIINGYYDSDSLIQKDKYKKGRDGYKVLYVDRCKIVLDINYTGVVPYNTTDKNDDFIKIYKISTREEFIYVNKQISSRGGSLNYKFNKNQNNMIFVDSNDDNLFTPVYTEKNTTISGIPTSYHIAGFGVNLGLTGGPGFFVRNGSKYWSNISKELFYYGTYSSVLGTYSNNKLKVMNGDFTYKGFEFKEGLVYEWYTGLTNSFWRVDKTYFKPIISKSNFRGGDFSGTFNNGLFGSQEKRISWKGELSNWYGGTLLNVSWEKGNIYSRISLLENYKATFDANKNPYQKANSDNNGGYGYNYIIDSYLKNSTVDNGNILNTKIGTSTTRSVLENHLKSLSPKLNNNIVKAYFEDCDFSSMYIDNATLINSKINDTKVTNSKVINSQIYDSVIKDSTFISENSIKIKAYDEWNISEHRYTNLLNYTFASSTYSIIQLTDNPNNIPNSRTSHKLYKFYIDEKDYKKLKSNDFFYLNGLKIDDSSKSVLNFFDKKFRFGTWTEFIDDYTISDINNDYIYKAESFYKRGIEYTSYLSTPEENLYVLNSSTTSVNLGFLTTYDPSGDTSTDVNKVVQYTNLPYKNKNSKYYSIDIIVSIQDILDRSKDVPNLNFNYSSLPSSSGTVSTYLGNKIDSSNAFIIDSNFESGIFETSDWNNGFNINYNNDVNISSLTGSGQYRFQLNLSSNTLSVENTQYTSYRNETRFNSGDIVYLNSIDYINGVNVTRMPDTYKILSVSSNNLVLSEVNSNVISGLTQGGYFTTNNLNNRYNYISKVKFEKSKIKSGLFKRSYFSKSLIKNDNYDSSDRDYNNMSNIRNLVISESIFSNNNNILSSATYLTSFFLGGSDIWHDGIIQNSLLNGMTFSRGVVKESRWENGVFTGGTFYNSRTFNGESSIIYPYYFSNRIKSFYINGTLGLTTSNNRFSWQNGTFTGGEFYKSDWENGEFKNGLFNYSKFYKGTFSGGNVGTIKNSIGDTVIYNGNISYTTVDSATFYSKDPNYSGSSYSNINWYNGIFNNGIFGSFNDTIYDYTTNVESFNNLNINLPIRTTPYSSAGFLTSNINSSSTSIVDANNPFEIKVKVKVTHGWVGDLVINLKSPNGKIINLKGLNEGGNNDNFTDTIWSSNDSNPTLSQVSSSVAASGYKSTSPPYFNFKMSKIMGTGSFGTYSFLSNTENVIDLLNNSTLNGNWTLILIDYFNGDLGYLDSWEITFNYKTINSIGRYQNRATWYNGIFNGGQFIDLAKWKNGTFNGGKFLSSYGFTQSGKYFDNSIDILDYTWENGVFNDGEFGRGTLGDNSTWYGGTFNGGTFKGRLWNSGLFTNGSFLGSATYSAIGGLNIETYESNASKFVDSYTQNFYGLWIDGIVSKNKDKYIKNLKFYYYDNKISKKYTTSNFENVLWLSGTFSNENGMFKNSVWISGIFDKGTFKNSSFNPYVRRGKVNSTDTVDFPRKLKPSDYSFTPNFNTPIENIFANNTPGADFRDRSVWNNGDLIESEFYMSKWYGGNFISGTAYGMIFLDGVSNYMNAYNVIWEGGTWKNGNWHGSDFEYNGNFIKKDGTTNNFMYNIVRRGFRDYGLNTIVYPNFSAGSGTLYSPSNPIYTPFLPLAGDNNLHIWNLFGNTNTTLTQISNNGSTNISFDISSEDLSIDAGFSNDWSTAVVLPEDNVWKPVGAEPAGPYQTVFDQQEQVDTAANYNRSILGLFIR